MVTFPSPGSSVWENMRTPQVQLFSRNSLPSPKLLLLICSSRGPLQRDNDQQQPNVISLRDPNPSPVTIFDERTFLCAAATKQDVELVLKLLPVLFTTWPNIAPKSEQELSVLVCVCVCGFLSLSLSLSLRNCKSGQFWTPPNWKTFSTNFW
jgi:hypothetical protein